MDCRVDPRIKSGDGNDDRGCFGRFRVNSAAKIFLGIALCKQLVLQHYLQATRARAFPDEEGIETVSP